MDGVFYFFVSKICQEIKWCEREKNRATNKYAKNIDIKKDYMYIVHREDQ